MRHEEFEQNAGDHGYHEMVQAVRANSVSDIQVFIHSPDSSRTATETKGRLLLNVVVTQSLPVFQLLSSEKTQPPT